MDSHRPDAPLPSTASSGDGWQISWQEPSGRADVIVMLTPVPEPDAPRGGPPGTAATVVTGAAVLAITAGLGRRAGAPARLTAVCSVGACVMVIAPRLAAPLRDRSFGRTGVFTSVPARTRRNFVEHT